MQENHSFEEDLAEHRKYLLRYAQFHVRDPMFAEDAVQETLIAALAQQHTFQGRSQLRTWLVSILRNKVVDQVRKHARQIPTDALSIDDEQDAPEGTFTGLGRWKDKPSDWGLPEAAFESQEFWKIYLHCCKLMSERLATVFSMREVLGLSADEICKEIGISSSNFHVMLYRARLSLQTCMTVKGFGRDHA
jgi:RNA polymerase sigma-70 factor (ECF subfamily)